MNSEKWHTAATRGKGKSVPFKWHINDEKITIQSDKMHHEYTHTEILTALGWLQRRFKTSPFPLGNSVSKVGNETEKDGLGKALYSVKKDTTFAQRASYLGVVLEQMGIFEFVSHPITWQFAKKDQGTLDAIAQRLKTYR